MRLATYTGIAIPDRFVCLGVVANLFETIPIFATIFRWHIYHAVIPIKAHDDSFG